MPVAQLDRASASGAEGRAFESPQARFAPFLFGISLKLILASYSNYVNMIENRCQGYRKEKYGA